MHGPAWLAPLLAAAWLIMTAILFPLLIAANFEVNEGRPTEVPLLSTTNLIGPEAFVAYAVLGVMAAALLFGASLATYWVLMSSARKHDIGDAARRDGSAPTTRLGGRRTSASSESSTTSADYQTRDEYTGVKPVGAFKKWLGRFGLTASAAASVTLVVASVSTMLTDTHNNAVIAYTVLELVWVLVASTILWSYRRRAPFWLQAIKVIATVGAVSGAVMTILGWAFFRNKKDFAGEVITVALLEAGLRVPDRLMSYFNVYALGELIFLGFLALFNLVLAYALRSDKVHVHGDVWAQGKVPQRREADVEMGKARKAGGASGARGARGANGDDGARVGSADECVAGANHGGSADGGDSSDDGAGGVLRCGRASGLCGWVLPVAGAVGAAPDAGDGLASLGGSAVHGRHDGVSLM
eukprot:TRINITY_DN4969_c0_g1_i1.p1 TRINITY_DN4969_c0_g1~~TRINITY_DN4969_c0_g1_i1.p1  ORF type:complete len:463 (-),score=159.48 TRINITY_DN4969_c0_g1_i1:196-1434(-)